jgi:hypothetical protein
VNERPCRTLREVEPPGSYFRRLQTLELHTIVESVAELSYLSPVAAKPQPLTPAEPTAPAAQTYQLPTPDSRRHALLAARRLVELARDLDDDGDCLNSLRPYFTELRREVNELERDAKPSFARQILDLFT